MRRATPAAALLATALGTACGAHLDPAPARDGASPPVATEEHTTVADPSNAPPAARSPGELPASLRVGAPTSSVDEPLELVVEAVNATDAPLSLLLWNTPFEAELSADAFRVTRDGEPVAYRGRLVKRALPPPPDAVVALAPGERLANTVELSRHYALDVPGTYAIELRARAPVTDAGPVELATLVAADASPVVVERR